MNDEDQEVDWHPARRPPARYVHGDLVQARPLLGQHRDPPVGVHPLHLVGRRLPKHDPAAVRLGRHHIGRGRRAEQRPERPTGRVQGRGPRHGARLRALGAGHGEVPQGHEHVARRVGGRRHRPQRGLLSVRRRPDPLQHGPCDLRGGAHPVPEAPLGEGRHGGAGAGVIPRPVGAKEKGPVRGEPRWIGRPTQPRRHAEPHAVEVDRVLQSGRPPGASRAPRRGRLAHHGDVDPFARQRARFRRVVGPQQLAHLRARLADVEARLDPGEEGVRRVLHLVPHRDGSAVDAKRQGRHVAPPRPLRAREGARARGVLARRENVAPFVVGDPHPPLDRQARHRGVLG
mmetsp:Transcript_32762/g.83882  ORF Transcript_32762/g.83882 Transcript_32762/m.83882 type:complete len:344 (-) Transcript_32762:741-1772(-)